MLRLVIILAAGLACAQTSPAHEKSNRSESGDQPAQNQSTGVSAVELARLRPVVERDLKEILKRVWNIDKPTAADLEKEFQRCRFTPLRLGKLGPAVLVEDSGTGGREVPMLNIYASKHGSYRLLIKEAGTGPMILPGPGSMPDIIFGTAGVCYSLSRYRYMGGKYQYDACLRREQDEHGNCVVKTCDKPAFPESFQGRYGSAKRFCTNSLAILRRTKPDSQGDHGREGWIRRGGAFCLRDCKPTRSLALRGTQAGVPALHKQRPSKVCPKLCPVFLLGVNLPP